MPEYSYILHLSDLHFTGPHEGLADVRGVKQKPSGRRTATRESQLRQVLESIRPPRPFDYVIVSGDITDRYSEQGFDQFDRFAQRMIQAGVFPAHKKRILIVPGNHDVRRPRFGEQELSDRERYEAFERKLGAYALPSFHWKRHDLEKEDLLKDDDPLDPRPMDGEERIWSRLHYKGSGEDRIVDGPFLWDQDMGLLIYLFDSAFRTGSREALEPEKIETAERTLATLKASAATGGRGKGRVTTRDVEEVRHLLSHERLWDWSEIDEGQFRTLDEICKEVAAKTRVAWEEMLKLAVVHHHVSDLPTSTTTIKPYDRIVNAYRLKNRLVQRGFCGVLHGHRHVARLLRDCVLQDMTAVNDVDEVDARLWIMSGGTIAGEGVPFENNAAFVLRVEKSDDGRAVRAEAKRLHIDKIDLDVAPDAGAQWLESDPGYVRIWPDDRLALGGEAKKTDASRLISLIDVGHLRIEYGSDFERRVRSLMSGDRTFDEVVQQGEEIRWDLLSKVQESTVKRFSALGLECIFYSLGSLEKEVRFRRNGTYEATTTYDDLQVGPDEKLSVTVAIPIHIERQGKTSAAGRKREVSVVQLIEGGEPIAITGENLQTYPSPVGEKTYVRLKRIAGQKLSYRMTYKHAAPFRLSRAKTREVYQPERTVKKWTWDKHYNALELTQSCRRLRLAVRFPLSIVTEGFYRREENFFFVLWPSGGHMTDELFQSREALRRDIGLGDQDWVLRTESDRRHLRLVLEIKRHLKVGMHYGILWEPPLP